MPTISKRELNEYRQMLHDKNSGRILTPEGLRFICEAYKNNPEAIGRHMLEILARFQSEKQY